MWGDQDGLWGDEEEYGEARMGCGETSGMWGGEEGMWGDEWDVERLEGGM